MIKKEHIKTGWAETDITPRGKCELAGQYYQRVSKGIHSRLSATVLAIKSESGEQAIMISMDTVGISPEFLNALRERVKQLAPDIIPEKIMINATHTHNAPDIKTARNWWTPDPGALKTDSYREFVLKRLANAVRDAWKNLKPGAIAPARTHTVVGHCRRAMFDDGSAEMYGDTSRADFMGLEGNEDSSIELMFTYDKKPTGVVVNVACPSQVMEATHVISSDFMGELRRLLKIRFGAGFHVLCQIAAGGDQSPHDLLNNRNAELWSKRGVTILGQRLADAVIKAGEKIKRRDVRAGIEMAHKTRTITLPKRFPSWREQIAAKKELARLEAIMPSKKAYAAFTAEVRRNEKIPDRAGPHDSKLHHFVLIRNAEAVIKRAEEQTPDVEMELHVLRLGNVVFCTNPFELFLDFGLRIKARSRAEHTFVVQLACGSVAYLPTARAEQSGGYGGLIINGAVGSDGGDKLVDETVHLIKSIWYPSKGGG